MYHAVLSIPFIYFVKTRTVMEVICLEEKAFYTLIDKVVGYIQEKLPEMQEDIWIDEDRAMDLLKKKKSSLQLLRDTGQIEYTQWNGKNILYDRRSILEWLEKNRKKKF